MTPELVLNLAGDFDASAACRVQSVFDTATSYAPVVLDFRGVRHCHPSALAWLFERLAGSGPAVQVRGLCRHHYLLLGYLGFDSARQTLDLSPQPARTLREQS